MSIFAAGRVLLGVWQPGHSVLLPLVAYNAVMGGVYVVAALRIRRDPVRGRQAAAGVALLNLGVLLLLIARAAAGGMVPHESVVAMSLRTAAWLVIVMLTAHVMRASAHANAATITPGRGRLAQRPRRRCSQDFFGGHWQRCLRGTPASACSMC